MKKIYLLIIMSIVFINLTAQRGIITYEHGSDFIQVPYNSAMNLSGDFTLSFKVKFDDINLWNMLITATGFSSGPELSYVNKHIQFTTTGMTADVTHAAFCPLENNKWYQIVFTREGNNWTSYVDGNLILTTNSAKIINYTSNHVMKIGNYYVPGYAFKGSMTEVSIWSVALDQNFIINSLPNGLDGNETGLVLYYNMNETGAGAGITVRNKAITGNVLDGITGGTSTTPYFTLITGNTQNFQTDKMFYPNPSKDVIYFNDNYMPEYIEIIQLDGKRIFKTKIENNSLNVSDIPNGQYIIRIISKKETVLNRFVKI